MADFSVPLNRVGVVSATLIDGTGAETLNQMGSAQWSVTGGGSSYFSLVVAADGLSAEIHPIAVGSGSVHIDASAPGQSTVSQTRTVEITANASDAGASGNYPLFIGLQMQVVHNIGSAV